MASKSDSFKDIAARVRIKTNSKTKLNKEISKLTKLSPADLKRIVPSKEDKEKFAKLMSIVSAHTKENIRAAELLKNMEELGEMVVHVLKKTLV